MAKYYQKRCLQFPDVIPIGKRKEWQKRKVPFKKRGAVRFWTEQEVDILKSAYQSGGIRLARKRLTRSDKSIMGKVKGLRLRCGKVIKINNVESYI